MTCSTRSRLRCALPCTIIQSAHPQLQVLFNIFISCAESEKGGTALGRALDCRKDWGVGVDKQMVWKSACLIFGWCDEICDDCDLPGICPTDCPLLALTSGCSGRGDGTTGGVVVKTLQKEVLLAARYLYALLEGWPGGTPWIFSWYETAVPVVQTNRPCVLSNAWATRHIQRSLSYRNLHNSRLLNLE